MTTNEIGLPVTPTYQVTQDDIDTLERDGVVILKGALPLEWIEPLRQATEDTINHPDCINLASSPNREGEMVNLFFGWTVNKVFEALATHSPISEIAKAFLPGQQVQFFYDQMFVKRPGTDTPTPWHRDRNYYAINGKDFLSIWVPFDPVSADETALTYLLGSHRHEDVLDRNGQVLKGGSSPNGLFDQMDDMPENCDTVTWDIELGDVVLHHLDTVHMAGQGKTNKTLRRAVATRWIGDDITYRDAYSILQEPRIAAGLEKIWPDLELKDGERHSSKHFPLVK